LGSAVVKTERDFPAVGMKTQDHRYDLALVFFVDCVLVDLTEQTV
jgi:hypothetical protein